MDGGKGKALAQGPTLGDVLDLADEIERLVVFVAHARHVDGDPHVVTVGVQVALLEPVLI